MKRALHRQQAGGFSLFESIVVIVILAVLIAVYLPAVMRPRGCAGGLSCVNNLKQVGLSFRQWALDNGDKYPMQVSVTNGGAMELVGKGAVFAAYRVMSNELNTPKILFCPQESDAKRTCATTFADTVPNSTPYPQIPFTNNNNVSYFVGVDATDSLPQMILSGDDNFLVRGVKLRPGVHEVRSNNLAAWTSKRHENQGNICFTDGSVQPLNSRGLMQALRSTGCATNRLAMP